MKIISKFKDYYDHLAGIYGEDPLLVLDRRANHPQFAHLPQAHIKQLPPPKRQKAGGFDLPSWTEAVLYVGSWRVYLFQTDARVYTSHDIQNADYGYRKGKDGCTYCFLSLCFNDGNTFYLDDNSRFHELADTQTFLGHRTPQAVNRRSGDIAPYAGVPLLLTFRDDNRQTVFVLNPQLSALGVYLPEQWLWQELSAYLGQLRSEAETSPPVPDKDKIGNKGFDVKRSFRPKMK